MTGSGVVAFVVKEVKEALPAIVFFATGFAVIELTTQLILDTYEIKTADFTVALLGAVLIGKSVLLANALPFFRRYDNSPLIKPILFKSFNYWVVVGLVRFVEHAIEYALHDGKLSGIPDYVRTNFPWNRFAAIQIWIFVLFLIYTTAAEMIELFGDGEMRHIFFASGSLRGKLVRHPHRM